MKDRVSIDLKDGVADVRLIRADKMNALDPAMFAALLEAGAVLHDMPGLRAVVLAGEGRSFVGVTPERLVSRVGRTARSEAVAGTRPRGKEGRQDDELEAEL